MKQLYSFDPYFMGPSLIQVFTVVHETPATYIVQRVGSMHWDQRVLKQNMRAGEYTLFATELAAAKAAVAFCNRRINAAQRRIDQAAAQRTLFEERIEELREQAK